MSNIVSMKNHKKQRELALANERRRLLDLTPEQALDAIVAHPYPVSLVQSFSEEDLYFFIHHIGPDDALPVLALASNEQWEYLADTEIWAAGKPDNTALTRWLERLLKADADRFTHWIIHDQRDLLEYYLFQNVEVLVREYEQDPAEIGEEFFTEDQVHYIRLRNLAAADPELEAFAAERDGFVTDLLKRLAVYDLTTHQQLLLESSIIIPAEAEEELLRLRNVRLAEKGFLPFDEAVGVYQGLSATELYKRQQKPRDFTGRQVESYPLRVEAVHLSDKADLFVRTLAAIQDTDLLQRLQAEFAALCNQVASADQKPVREKSDLARVVDKVSGYLSLALETIDAQARTPDPYRRATLLQTYLLADIFRVGYGRALSLKWKADKWRQTSWFEQAGLPLGFWAETWLGVLGGLLIKKPLYFANYAGGALYREFSSLQEIAFTEKSLEQIFAMDHLLSRLTLDTSALPVSDAFTYANLLLTLWADHHLGLDDRLKAPQPLSISQFRRFFEQLWKNQAPPRRVNDAMREQFLAWLAERSGMPNYEISERLGPSLEGLFTMIETELGTVAVRDLDPRFIYLFLLKVPTGRT